MRYGDVHLDRPRPDATIDVFRREDDGVTWTRVGSVPVLPAAPAAGGGE
jgi:hypothetical protein